MNGPRAPVRWRMGALRRRETLWATFFLSPWIIGMLGLTVGPMIWSFYLSLTDYDAIPFTRDRFLGLGNYQRLLEDPRVALALQNTVTFTVMYVPLSIGLALGLALLLQRVGRAAGLFRTAFYLPSITPAVAVGALFLLLLNGQAGLLNQILGTLHLPRPSWLYDAAWIKPGIVLMLLWTVGSTVIILLAALMNVPREMYDAAKVDGAGGWQRFRSITVPFTSGALFFVIIIHTIAALNLFDQVYTIFYGRQANQGAAGDTSALFYVVYIFRNAFEFQKMGYAAALAWVLFLITLVITAIHFLSARRWVYYAADGS